jgi:hypothetical protein
MLGFYVWGYIKEKFYAIEVHNSIKVAAAEIGDHLDI